ncbi:hypothetical protein [Phaeobacter gallaeciensis]|uniref:hypothetical protein n=1 Tax=Phaeobacter gallaeciensis TaxID=60890 RepID=UPI0003D6A1E5|nr:hypothetical protein [Phaeobacter gallaeciensis]AHD12168.1 hypothetical protein Gal_04464 [Phaeobacter gallaeciensis DSM 26640]ATE95352.1 hypothetical protein PhaeoP11_04368 [Phaeobacter gallaeciensis]
MADRPILFSAPMVNAILREIRTPGAGKTQTRRLLKIKGKPGFFQFGVSDTRGYDWTFRRKDHVWEDFRHDDLMKLLPVQSGDRLFVREHWKACSQMDGIAPRNMSKGEPVFYLADSMVRELGCMMIKPGKHRQSMHMPRWASRITLEVSEVRIERLQDISAEDARDEGVNRKSQKVRQMWLFGASKEDRDRIYLRACKWEFQDLWDRINGTPRKPEGPDISWDANPWVMAITFTPHLCNIDQMAKAA